MVLGPHTENSSSDKTKGRGIDIDIGKDNEMVNLANSFP